MVSFFAFTFFCSSKTYETSLVTSWLFFLFTYTAWYEACCFDCMMQLLCMIFMLFWSYVAISLDLFVINIFSLTKTSRHHLFLVAVFTFLEFSHASLSVNDMQLYSHAPTHASIYLGLLWSHVQNFIWQVHCIPTLQQVYSVIFFK